jgi:hypothetical protein
MPTLFSESHDQADVPSYSDVEAVNTMRRGANWFYWIAGLSLINSAIFAFGGNVSFIIGLGFSQIIDAFSDAIVANGGPSFIRILAIMMDVGIFAFFALVGYYSNKAFKAAFMIGIAVYAIDALLWLLFGGYFEIAFHIYALFWIVRGFLACKQVSN